jgi:hypothetical protein
MREQIDMLLHKVDERHWPQITAMRVKSYYPADTPVPPQSPEHLRQEIHWYASMLFKTEADQYDQFRSDARYPKWLSNLALRTTARVMKNLEKLESSGTNPLESLMGLHGALILGYHGLTTQQVEDELRTTLAELCDQYERGTAPGQSQGAVTASPPSVGRQPAKSTPLLSRTELANAYLAVHPGVIKLDVCWAAGQHYSEWKRWLRGADTLKDGSTPDQAFRALLESGKSPSEYKTRPRPRGWK